LTPEYLSETLNSLNSHVKQEEEKKQLYRENSISSDTKIVEEGGKDTDKQEPLSVKNPNRKPISIVTEEPQPTEGEGQETSTLRRVTSISGYTLPVKINDVLTHALIDSGSTSSVISRHIYEAMPPSLKLRKTRIGKVMGVSGN
jgi:hypothetical protein